MSILFIVASKCGVTTQTIKINNGTSLFCRSISVAPRHRGTKIDSFQTNNYLRRENNCALRNSRHFSGSSWLSSIKENLSHNNVLSSRFPEISGFSGTYVHEHIYKDLHKWSDKTALICSATGRSYTYEEMRKLAGKLATSLRKSNLRPGDTIAVVLPNVPEYAILLLAVSEAGLRATLINPVYTAEEISVQIKNSNAAAVFTVPSKHAVVAASIAGNSNIRMPIIVIEDGNGTAPEGTIKFSDLIRNDIEEFSKTGEKTGIDTEDTFILPYSSGTSGLPKGVDLSHRNLVANLMQVRVKGILIASEATASHQEVLPIILPIYHIYGLMVVLKNYLCSGGKLICVPQFTPDIFFKVLEENRVSKLYVAPPLVQLLANDERLNKRHVETIEHVISGAAPISEEVLTKFLSKTPPSLKIIQGYGLTECAPVISLSSDAPIMSAGYVLPNTQIRIVGYEAENEGKNLGVDEVGEIYIRGPQVMNGYYKNPEATANCMEGDWFKTGDLGSFDKSGLIYIRGRLKELIKVQAFQVAPAEIEHLIQGHAKVADAAVIGVSHEKYGEIPKAFVVPKTGVKLDANEIKEYVAERVAKYKQLGHVEFIDKIPKSAAGKILRRELQKM